jgi:hypothetical protein
MTCCQLCQNWAATTVDQLNARLRNASKNPGTQPYACPNCGSTDWLTTSEYVVSLSQQTHNWWGNFLQRLRGSATP